MIDSKTLQITFFFLLFGVVSLFSFLVFRPFFLVIFLSAVFAVLLQPFYKKTLSFFRGYKTISAVFVLLTTLIFIATPLYFLGIQVSEEASNLYSSIQSNGGTFLETINYSIEAPIRHFVPGFIFNIRPYLSNFAGFLLSNLGQIVSGTAFVLFEMLLTIVTLYYFLKNGEDFADGLIKLSPLDDRYDREILNSMKKTIHSVLRGALFIAVIQGILVGTGLHIFQVPNASLWGLVAALCALVPGMGTALITIPSIVFLFLSGNTGAALGLLLWSALLVGTIDNFLAPYLYTKGIQVHPLFVFFSVIGGIAYFGPMGFLFGPIILSAFLSLLHIYRLFILREGGEVSEGA
ncbi:MAG: AI-2E family transporter [Candidatus Parcubacteria bacterium]|nr:AI-2E family transporter [Candidatus Parcubacteria bacterium]